MFYFKLHIEIFTLCICIILSLMNKKKMLGPLSLLVLNSGLWFKNKRRLFLGLEMFFDTSTFFFFSSDNILKGNIEFIMLFPIVIFMVFPFYICSCFIGNVGCHIFRCSLNSQMMIICCFYIYFIFL